MRRCRRGFYPVRPVRTRSVNVGLNRMLVPSAKDKIKFDMNSRSDTGYRIGAVARLTGVAADTLRMWERRYRVVEPGRACSGSRLYTRDDIRRLAMVKRLVDAGQAIGTVAQLDEGQLEESLGAFDKAEQHVRTNMSHLCRVTVLGDALSVRFSGAQEEASGLDVLGAYGDKAAFERNVGSQKPDVVLMEFPTLHEDTIPEVWRLFRRSGAKHVVVIYAFGPSTTITKLEAGRALMVRAPVASGELRRICLNAMKRPVDGAEPRKTIAGLAKTIPPRRFSDESLARISATSTPIQCECPHHLADLVMSLAAFENYSLECESRNAKDAALHAYLNAATARARSVLEAALERVIKSEGLAF